MKANLQTIFASLALVAAGVIAGAVFAPNSALGQAKTPPQPPAFQNAAQLSLPVLKEMAATLQQMDARLAHLESIGQQMRNSSAKTSQLPTN